jgi:hypothetical protein
LANCIACPFCLLPNLVPGVDPFNLFRRELGDNRLGTAAGNEQDLNRPFGALLGVKVAADLEVGDHVEVTVEIILEDPLRTFAALALGLLAHRSAQDEHGAAVGR